VLAALIDAEARSCKAAVQAVVPSSIPVLPAIHLAVAPTKQIDRFEWLLEKCTELGVQRITPLLTERTERAHLRHDRLLKVLVGAMKQSQRDHLPRLDAPTPLADLLSAPLPPQRFFGYCIGEHRSLMAAYTPGQDALVLIGPEGDFTPEEADQLARQQFVPVSLGAARLRTETAAVSACTWMNFAQQV
jgi:16S rRNA (uracil1498-N3)-methyltransferase